MTTSGTTKLVFKMAQNGTYTELSKKGYADSRFISAETAAKNAAFRLERKNNPRKIPCTKTPEQIAAASARFKNRKMK